MIMIIVILTNDINNAAVMISPMLVVIWSYLENRDPAL